MIQLGIIIFLDFVTKQIASGSIGAHAPDGLPTCDVFEDDNTSPIYSPVVTLRTGYPGVYFAKVDIIEANGFQKGHSYSVVASYSMSAVQCREVLKCFYIDDYMDNLTKVASVIRVEVPQSFTPVTGPPPMIPPTWEQAFPPDSEFYEEINDLYNRDTKTWSDKKDHTAEAEAEVTFWENQQTDYNNDYIVWKRDYDLQKDLQWRKYAAEQLIDITE